MKELGRNADSKEHWEEVGAAYSAALENDYHAHRMGVIRKLIPDEIFAPGKTVFDFGCGDAVVLEWFLSSGATVRGVDISEKMIQLAKERLIKLGKDPGLVELGGVDQMAQIPTSSVDALLSFNVLAYLSDKEESAFYQHASRILRPGGFLVVTHSNELFDMFSLNSFTFRFFKKHFVMDVMNQENLRKHIVHTNNNGGVTSYNIRENPLCYKFKLQKYGFEEISQEFINFHKAPPAMLDIRSYPDTNVEEDEKWKLMFQCSTYGSCSVKVKE